MAGQATTISKYLRRRGIECDLLVFNRHPFGYEEDINLNLDSRRIWRKALVLVLNFLKCAPKYDIFHFHFGRTLLPRGVDLPILKMMGKKLVMHYWGDDVRQNDISINYTYLNYKELKSIYPQKDDHKIRDRIKWMSKYLDASIVGDYSLLPYVPGGKVIKQAIDLNNLEFVGAKGKDGPIKIVHAPSNEPIKGTDHVLQAMERLKGEGYKIDFTLMEKMNNGKVMELCRDADIVVDQLLLESYGIFAIECMALGKPVLCRVDEHFVKCYPNLPIVNTDPDNIYQNLKLLIEDPGLRAKLGLQGRRFVEEVHDARKIAQQLAELYQSL